MININIANILLSIFTDDNQIRNYITREFENNYLNDNIDYIKPSVSINIYSTKKYEFKIEKKINNNIFTDSDKNIMQIIKAKGRKTIVIYSKNFEKINIYIPYKTTTNEITKIINPKYLAKWQNCLIDFFHGPFLGILEYFLLKKDYTFIHGSSFCYNSMGYVFSGKAQVGKTEIVNSLKNDAKILSDDFTILLDNSHISPYQKSIGVFLENINFDTYYSDKKRISIIFEKINFKIFKILRFKPKRILFFKEVFTNSYSKDNIELNKIFYINRDNDNYKIKKIEVSEYVPEMVKILENEFNNLQNFWILLDECTDLNKETFMLEIKNCLEKCLKYVKLYSINIPFYEEKHEFRTKIKNILLDVLKERKEEYED